MRFLIIGSIFTLVMAAINYYSYRRFFKKLHFGRASHWGFISLALFGIEILFILQTFSHALPDSPQLYYFASASIGISFILFFIALIYDVLHSTASKIPFHPERRQFIKIIFDVTMIIAAVSYLFKGFCNGLKQPELTFHSLSLGEKGVKPFRIVQLTDVHVGLSIKRDFVEDCVRRINELKPDLVVITGDLVDRNIEQAANDLEPLKHLQSTFGSYFVTGNHEYFHDVENIIKHVRTLNITPLLNQSVNIAGRFNLVGINDLISKQIDVLPYDIPAAFADCDPNLKTIVLAHQPKTVTLTTEQKFDLMLSGHTHGGQIFPFGLMVMIDQPYLAGLYQINDSKQIFVSRSTGYWGPPIRILAPSEIAVLDIV